MNWLIGRSVKKAIILSDSECWNWLTHIEFGRSIHLDRETIYRVYAPKGVEDFQVIKVAIGNSCKGAVLNHTLAAPGWEPSPINPYPDLAESSEG